MSNEAFERNLRGVLAGLAPVEVPRELHAHVAQLAASPGSTARQWLPRLGSMALGFAVVAVAIVVGAVALNVLRAPAPLPPGGVTRPLAWSTELVSLEAGSISIEAGGRTFIAAADRFSVISDPGTPNYRTLEITWTEQALEMRLNLYFAADETHWWVSEIRTYDGMPRSDWITYRGEFFKTERGSAYEGSVELTGSGRAGGGRLRIDDMRLAAFVPGTGPRPFENCQFIGPAGTDAWGRPIPQRMDPDLSEFGLVPGMTAGDAYDRIVQQGLCYEFRLEFPALNQGQHWCVPPPGTVREFLFGSEGQLLVFVEDRNRTTSDPNMPDFVGCN